MVKKNSLDIIILSIILFGILILGEISYNEYIYGNVCSKFSIIPACYIAFIYFLLLFIFQVWNKIIVLFLILSGFALTLTGFASIGHLIGTIQCPISDIGIPTCFIGFFMFLILLILKFLQVKIEKHT